MHIFDQLSVWDDPDVAARLSWYRDVACGRLPAKLRSQLAVYIQD